MKHHKAGGPPGSGPPAAFLKRDSFLYTRYNRSSPASPSRNTGQEGTCHPGSRKPHSPEGNVDILSNTTGFEVISLKFRVLHLPQSSRLQLK